jgi:methionyl-tRNA formyltransferase
MVRALHDLEHGRLVETPQPRHGVTYAAKIGKSEGRIDFARPAPDVHNLIRALSPSPAAWFEWGEGTKERIRALRSAIVDRNGHPGDVLDDALTIACGKGAVRLLEVQRPGKRAMSAAEFLRGHAVPRGARLSCP